MKVSATKKNYYLPAALALLLFLITPATPHAQTLAPTGKDFWLGYGAHAAMFNADGSVNNSGGAQELRLYISAVNTTSVTIEIPLTGWTKTITIPAGDIDQQVVIPKTAADDARLTAEGVFNKGIHITSSQPVSAWCHLYSKGSSAASMLLSEEILGQEYYVLGATQAAKETNSFSWCFVVATADETLVEITPSANTLNHAANVPFTQQLKRGQVLNLIGAQTSNAGGIYKGVDLTGTRIRTLNNSTGPCKKIAVFSGSSNTSVWCAAPATGDNLFQQSLPLRAWGKTYYTVPPPGAKTTTYRVYLNKPTAVRVNGTLLTNPVDGRYYEFSSIVPCKIGAASPVLAAQLTTSQGQCGNTGNGDPEITYLAPYEYSLSHVTLNSPRFSSNITSHYISVVLRTVSIDSFTVDNVRKSSFFKPLPADANYSYAQIPVSSGAHTLNIDTLSFVAVASGYGPAESYAYSAGFSIRLSTIGIKNPYSTTTQQNICKTIPFRVVYTLKKKATELIFNFNNNPDLSPNNIVDIKNPDADSVYFNGFDSVYTYILPASYVYTGAFNVPVSVTEFMRTAEDCIEKQAVDYKLIVTSKPIAVVNLNYNTCGQDKLNFNENSIYPEGRFIDWRWQFGDGTTSTDNNPVKTYKSFADYKVQLRAITQNGCFADTIKNISLNPLPKAGFGIKGLYCPQNDLQFTDSSNVINGWQVTKWAWNFGDGTTSSTQNPVKQFNAGNYSVKLVAYTNKNCADSITKPVKVYAPDNFKEFINIKNAGTAADTLLTCSTVPFKLSATFTIRQAEIHWNFNNNTSLTPNSNVDIVSPEPDSVYFNGQDSFFRYSLPASYSFSGTGNLPVKLTAYIRTKGGCLAQTIFTHNITVLQKPVANWLLVYDKCANDTLHFTDKSTGNGSNIIQRAWNFGDGTAATIASPVKKYANYGDYNVSLHINTDIGCSADTVMPISLSPKPVAAFGFTADAYCPGQNIMFTDSSTIDAPGMISKWQWNFGNEAVDSRQNPLIAYTAEGDYTVTLITNTDGNCADTAVKTVSIFAKPTISIQQDIFNFAGTPFQLTPAYTGSGLTYRWTPPTYLNNSKIANPVTSADKDITYTVAVSSDGGCIALATVNLHVVRVLTVPNAFSPNGDGVNDKWMIANIEGYPNCTVQVFNRYGQLIFSSVGYNTPWDGTVNGHPLPVGTYYYIIDTKSDKFPRQKGDVTILR